MKFKAGIEGIIAIAVAIGWAVLKALASQRQDADAWGEMENKPATPPHVPDRHQGTPPVVIPHPGRYATAPPHIPLPRKSTPKPASLPPAPRPNPLPAPLSLEGEAARMAPMNESLTAYQRGKSIQERVEKFMAAVDRETQFAKPAAVARPLPSKASHDILKMFRHPATAPQAFLASFVLHPPKALDPTSDIP